MFWIFKFSAMASSFFCVHGDLCLNRNVPLATAGLTQTETDC